MRTAITRIHGRRVWDSRGRPTLEAEVILEDGSVGLAIAPAGASVGTGEACDLRDGGQRLGGLDVQRAIANVNGTIAAALDGFDATDQSGLDRLLTGLDRSERKTSIGGNATIAVSMAALHASARSAGLPLWEYVADGGPVSMPLPEIQILGGGAHAGRRVDIQDFLVVCPSAGSFAEALERTAEVYAAAGRLLAQEGKLQGVADEGGWWPAFDSNEEALDFLLRAIEDANYTPGEEVSIALDIAASEFGSNGRYRLGLEKRDLDRDGLSALLLRWIERYPILSIEDPFAEDDELGFRQLMAAVGDRVQIVGDDFLVTSARRVERAAREHLATTVLIKPNQAGTITETLAALEAARATGMSGIVSARSGETEDVTIAHLAVGWNVGQFKVGSITRGERTAKWNEMLRIEEKLGGRAVFAGQDFLDRFPASPEQLDKRLRV